MRKQQSILSIRGLRKSYKKAEVLRGIDLEIEEGSIFCLLGSNGAGKTTTVRILSTLVQPDEGEITVCGYVLLRQPGKVRRMISLTGQYAAVDELLTGRENLRMIGRLFHVKDMEQRSEQLLRRFELEAAANRPVSTYSGGMRRKLDIVRSLMGDPRLLFLDEPTTGLDPQNRIAMWQEIEKLRDSGVTIFLTTQYLEEAERLADRVAILDKGRIVADGTVEELKALLPAGAVALAFEGEQFDHAAILLSGWQAVADEERRQLTVMTGGTATELTELLVTLQAAGICALSVTPKQPTLEEVFLTQVGARTGGGVQ